MLADPKASAMAENFAGQWLEIRNLDSIKPDPQKFPAWGPELRDAMKTETRMFFDWILRENRPISEFIDARYTFLNEMLATYYGIDGVTGPEFRRVDLTTNERGGVLSHGSVLAVSSYPTRTSVVIRGKYILQNILGAPPPPPPPDVPALDEQAVGTTASLRKQMEVHRTNAVCASCHSRMDPLGFALENYDAIGKWRTMDGGFPVDSSGKLPGGKTFSNPAELRQILSQRQFEFSRTLTEKLLIYALGRGLAALRPPDHQRDHEADGNLRLRLPDARARGGAQPAVPVAARRSGEDGRGRQVAPLKPASGAAARWRHACRAGAAVEGLLGPNLDPGLAACALMSLVGVPDRYAPSLTTDVPRWLVSRRFDLTWFFGGAALSVLFLALYFVIGAPIVALWWIWLLAFDGPHIGAAFTRTYLDTRRMAHASRAARDQPAHVRHRAALPDCQYRHGLAGSLPALPCLRHVLRLLPCRATALRVRGAVQQRQS